MKIIRDAAVFAALTSLVGTATAATDEAPVGSYRLGSVHAYHTLPLAQRPFVFRNMDELTPYPVRAVRHGGSSSPLPDGPPLDTKALIDGKLLDIDGFMEANQAAAMIVLVHGRIVAERYRMGNMPGSRWVMFSVSKSVTSTLLGAALRDGAIRSLDDPVTRYLPELAGPAWNGVTIRQTLRMSSGIDLHDAYETNEPQGLGLAYTDPDKPAPLQYSAGLPRAAAPGTRFSYSGANTYVLGRIISKATGRSLSAYLSEKIWAPMGMEDDAYWRLDRDGYEVAQGGLSATLRDMARFGLLALHGGRIGSQHVVPPTWFHDATDPAGPDFIRPGAIKDFDGMGYGYQWWTMPRGTGSHQIGDDGAFAALGIYGQQIYVLPKQDMVVVIQSATPVPVPFHQMRNGRTIVGELANALSRR